MKMLSSDVKKYPKFADYVKNKLPRVIHSAIVVKAMEEVGQINRAKFIVALTWGRGVSIKIQRLVGSYGVFTPGAGSNEITIDRSLVEEYERGNVVKMAPDGVTPLVGVTLLHELVHWGDDQDGIDRPGEEGEEFERMVYGAVIG